MERLALRTVAIMLVIAVLGGLLLMNRADRLRRAQRAAREAAAEDSVRAAANPDSVRAVAAAIAAYDGARRARGLEPLTVRVLSYVVDNSGVAVMLIPERLEPGAGATIQVHPDGSTSFLAP